MIYTPPFRRVDTAKGHHYLDAVKTRVPGSTTIIDGGTSKQALINWAGESTAEYAVNHWDTLASMPPGTRLKALYGGRYENKDKAAKRGTEVHGYAEQLINGKTVDVPEELHGYVESYARLIDAYKVEPVEVEFGIANYEHGYAGTADLVAWFTHKRWGRRLLLVDLKTTRSGIWGETALQLASYRFADAILASATSPERPMIEVDGCAGIHVRSDGADLVPVTADETVFASFLHVKRVYEWGKVSRDLVGAPVQPDVDYVPLRVVRDEEVDA